MDQAAGTGDDKKLKNTLPIYGNKETMNLNTMILTNIQSSPYFKEDLYQYKTFHEVVDEIYYRVEHLEPWEKNSRKLAGQVGMCGGVRGVAAGGIVSTAFCLLYKLFTLKLTRRQVNTMLNHPDSPYIRGLGIMYIRYCQPPADFWDWLEPYLDDEEEIDLKAGGGFQVTIGEMVRNVLTKLDWFGTLFPRVPLTVQKVLEERIREARKAAGTSDVVETLPSEEDRNGEAPADEWGEAGRRAKEQQGVVTRRRSRSRERRQSRSPRRRSRGRNSRERRRDGSRERRRDGSRERRRDGSRERRRDDSRERRRDGSRERRRDDSRERRRDGSRERRRDDSRERRRDDSRERRRERRRSRSRERARERRPRSRSRERRSHSRERRKRRSRSRDRSKERRRSRERSKSRERKGRRERSRSRDRPRR